MTTLHLPDWARDLPLTSDLWLDVGFTMDEALYYGPANDVEAILAGRFTALMHLPDLDIWEDEYVLTLGIEGNEKELAEYYRRILDLADRKQKPISELGHYFWLNPVIADEEPLIEFESYDFLEDIYPLLDAIASEGDGLIYTDRREDWQLDIFALGADLYIREWDWEKEEDYTLLRVPREQFRKFAGSAKSRTEKIIEALTRELGTNFWSRGSAIFVD